MGANDPALLAYAEAVRRMRALPAGDRRNWEQQAQTHLNFCPHGNWWFLPWHRAYLHRFEEICREVLNDDGFALPYWNWSRDARLPAAFLDPSSPLFHPGRLAGPGDRAEAEMVGGDVIQSQILPETDFTLFAGGAAATQRQGAAMAPLEAQPHNHVHVFIGGDMATFMSPRDPIFWLHHANVDRIWEIWNRRGNANSSDPAWGSLTYSEFVDRNGSPVSIPTADMNSIAALGYGYDSFSVAPGFAWREPLARLRASTQGAPFANLLQRRPRAVLRTVNDRLARPLQPHELRVSAARARLAPEAAAALGMETGAAPAQSMLQRPDRVVVKVGDMQSPQNQNVVVRVFVNCDYLSSSTPVSDPHYVGSFGFFCHQGPTNCYSGEMATTKDVTAALRRLQGPDYSAEDVRVQLMPVDLNGRSLSGCEFYARSVEVAVI